MERQAQYLSYIATQKRYSVRTQKIYEEVLTDFLSFAGDGNACPEDDSALKACLSRNVIRAYQIEMMDGRKMNPRTVNLHLSVLSGFCKFLVRQNVLSSNPVSLVTRPKQPKRLPEFFREEAMDKYLEQDNALTGRYFELDFSTPEEKEETYGLCLRRMIVSLLYSTGMRRSELISLKIKDFDQARHILSIKGKGDKMRQIPLLECVIKEILLYLHSVDRLTDCRTRTQDDPLLVTFAGAPLYPVLVDRAVKAELGPMGSDFAGRKSPHVLRHTFATGLLEEGADLNSIKEVLGHANLAATQVYTHSSARQLKKIYEQAHPRANNKGGNNGN